MKLLIPFMFTMFVSYLVYSANAQVYFGPDMQACIVYYDEHKAIIKYPPLGDSSDAGGCKLQASTMVLSHFSSLGYKITPESLEKMNNDLPWTIQVTMEK